MPWRRKWQPTPVFLPGESHGQRTLAGYSPWGHRESDTTERLTLSLHFQCVLALPHLTSFFSDLFGRLCASMKEILPAILVNNRCGSHQAIIFQRCQQWALGGLGMETWCPPSNQTLQPLPDVPLGKPQMRNHRTLAPESWEVHMEAMISASPDVSIFSYRDSPTWDVWFSLINSNLFIFWLPGLCCKNPCAPWILPCLSEAVSQSCLRC